MISTESLFENATKLGHEASNLGLKICVERLTPEDLPFSTINFKKRGIHLAPYVNSPVGADVELVIKKETYFAHRQTLAVTSRYFRDLFRDNQDIKIELELPFFLQVDEALLILEYAYCGFSHDRIYDVCKELEVLPDNTMLRIALVVHLFGMKDLLQELLENLVQIGPYCNVISDAPIPFDIIKGILVILKKKRQGPFQMMNWLSNVVSNGQGRKIHGWNLTDAGNAQLLKLFKGYVMPLLKDENAMIILRHTSGVAKEIMDLVPPHLLVQSIQPST